ncbi:MAG: hypothetical protein L6R36_003976 [Xanthoria steineri]|nr:MAG: hypothetical protein L6R36_003976 [Xanthoria steineri]
MREDSSNAASGRTPLHQRSCISPVSGQCYLKFVFQPPMLRYTALPPWVAVGLPQSPRIDRRESLSSITLAPKPRISPKRNHPVSFPPKIPEGIIIDGLAAIIQHPDICYEQPQPLSAPVLDFDDVRPASRASRASQFIAESRNLASRASRRASSATRRSTSRRPTIGAPSDFRRVDLPRGRTPTFRPLQLSIYLPGNELPCLPTFQEADEDNAGLVYPAQALIKSRSDSMLSRPSTAFNPRPVHRRPDLAGRHSTQDFLDALDTRLPQAPPALQHKLGPEPVYTLYRRASEQSLRLRTHLEERSRIESLLPECDTILEEKHADPGGKSKALSPILDRDETTPVDDLLGNPTCWRPSNYMYFTALVTWQEDRLNLGIPQLTSPTGQLRGGEDTCHRRS